MQHKHSRTEVAIVGGGLVGLTTAVALASVGVKSIVVELKHFDEIEKQAADGRSSAIAYGSYLFLKQIGAWDEMAVHAGPILDIRITDSDSSLFLHYDHKLVGDEPMGYMLANNDMWTALYKKAKESKLITLSGGNKWNRIENDSYASRLYFENGSIIESSLLIAADGKFSKVRESFGIQTRGWKYAQSGIVCNVRHEKNHQGVAQERFLPSGPFAILPLKGGHESSLVWTEKSDLVPLFMKMGEQELAQQINQRFGDYLGKLTLSSKLMSYPLSLSNADSYTAQRLLLVGDAAHAIHPIAGQGFNLGIRDVEALLPFINKAKSLGLDLACEEVVDGYSKARKFDVTSLIAITDVLNRLFSNNIPPLKIGRRLGLSAVNKLPTLKKFFMNHAMGMVSK